MLATDQLHDVRETFDRDGFVVVPDLIPPAELAELRRMVDAVLDGTIKPESPHADPVTPLGEDFDIQWEPRVKDRPDVPRREKVRVVFHMSHSHPFFWRWANHPRILEIVRALAGPEIKYYTDQMFVKPPKHGSEVPWHQDSAYWPDAEPRLLSCWVAIDDVTVENGCVRFIPGTHKQERPHHEIVTDNPNNITTRPEFVDPSREVPVVMRAGSVSFHHSLAVHRSLPNMSDRGRRGWALIYLPADLKFYRPWNFKHGFRKLA